MPALTGTTISASDAEPARAGSFACVACGREQALGQPVVRADQETRPFDLYRCCDCSLVQQQPRYSAAEYRSLYRSGYYVFAEGEQQRWARAVQQYVLHLLPLEQGVPRRLLDVGCALGHLAALASQRGWRVTGLDISPEAVSEAASRFGLDFRAGTPSQFRDTLPPFDVVLLGDVVEHVQDPYRFLVELQGTLAPGGVVSIDTPNWGGRWRWLGRSRWLGLNQYHVNLFDAECLTRLLTACGYSDIRTTSYTHYRYEPWSARPEVLWFVHKLPKFIAWRLERFLARRGVDTPWTRLRTDPPDSLENAGRVVDDLAELAGLEAVASTAGDNLIASACSP
jgi:2-polyprenyl-3-methyl-5-hydroxy-6-metoxy-1,4-benzoquinol methylase